MGNNVRATRRQEAILKRAATASDKTLTDFVVESAVSEATRLLADRAVIYATDEEFAEFQRLLDAPLPDAARIGAFLSRPSAL
ncbi:MAG: DUF1778 domain-containing protein [Bifidobacteriaceae bacterium]|nr:DUF1778 domain-containing protein [Bifidobacteriaceae bacterium]